ncbi:MAG: transcriptional regulator, partial [Prevotella sp.]|nr:transcriptional regulator [Prevotella sp.]
NWNKFEENFNLVYDNFSQKIMEAFPQLKKSDLKLCVYLRMGLSSKEMPSLLNTSVRSIETARYRLRKKLDIDTGSNLTDFIQGFGN